MKGVDHALGQQTPHHAACLPNDDGTLRCIVPADRGKKWGN